jgi:hypothetical protein
MKKILSFVLFVLFFSGCTDIKQLSIFLPHDTQGMKKISSKLYVEDTMSKEDIKQLEKNIKIAKEYVKEVYKELNSSAIIYACISNECKDRFGLQARAHHLLNHIVLSKKGLSKEIIAHEYAHAELYSRVGLINLYKIPRWFDEGLAVYISKDTRTDEKAWQTIKDKNIPYPSKDELISFKEFNEATAKYNKNIDGNKLVVSYTYAGHIMAEWYTLHGTDGLLKYIDDINNL